RAIWPNSRTPHRTETTRTWPGPRQNGPPAAARHGATHKHTTVGEGDMKGHHWKGLLAAFAGTTALCSAAPAAAQTAGDAAAASAGLEEILVTSRKREERLQDVPDSIFVLSSLQLEMSNVESLRDFVDLTPNLLVRETFRSNETFLTMRGLSSAQGSLTPVAFVVACVQ